MNILVTQRLILRPITMQDAEEMYEYSREPNVGPNAGWKPHESIEETRQIMQQIFVGAEDIFGIVLREGGRLVGSIGFMPDAKRQNPAARMLGYAMSESCWGKGLMSEAVTELLRYGFEERGFMLISAYCYPFNARSRGVLLHQGMQYEGRLRCCEEVPGGDILDNECYSITAEEYRARA